MKKRLLEIITKDNYGDEDQCICAGCIFYKTKTDLFKLPSQELFDKAKERTYKAIEYLAELEKEQKMNPIIDPLLAAICVLEELLGKRDFSMDELRDNALILGYIHSFVQFLWNGHGLQIENPNIDSLRLNKIMFRRGYVESVEPIEIGLESNDGYVVFTPTLMDDFNVDMEYKFVGNPQGFGCFEDIF